MLQTALQLSCSQLFSQICTRGTRLTSLVVSFKIRRNFKVLFNTRCPNAATNCSAPCGTGTSTISKALTQSPRCGKTALQLEGMGLARSLHESFQIIVHPRTTSLPQRYLSNQRLGQVLFLRGPLWVSRTGDDPSSPSPLLPHRVFIQKTPLCVHS